MDIYRYNSSYVFRYRALWDKIMGLLILVFVPNEYASFFGSKKKLKAFKKIAIKIPEIDESFITQVSKSLDEFSEKFRTPEVHGTGSLRKWAFLVEDSPTNPEIELLYYSNFLNETMLKISKIFEIQE